MRRPVLNSNPNKGATEKEAISQRIKLVALYYPNYFVSYLLVVVSIVC